MITAIVKLKSAAPYSQSEMREVQKEEKETHDVFEKRSWMEKGHYMPDGEMFIPPMALKKSVETAARELALQIPGRGKKTYKSAFKNGILAVEPVLLGINRNSGKIRVNWILANADGVSGSGKRVPRAFPTVDAWEATWTVMVVNEAITEEVFTKHIEEAGKYVGIGQFRPENGGFFGRFTVESVKWVDDEK